MEMTRVKSPMIRVTHEAIMARMPAAVTIPDFALDISSVTGAPQFRQNFASVGSFLPHCGQYFSVNETPRSSVS